MRKPVDLLGEGGDTEESGDSYCVAERELGFKLRESRSAAVGAEVRLRPGEPVEVFSDGSSIGTLGAREGQSMMSCIAMGYRMEGKITSIDFEAQQGRILVSGTYEGGSS